MSKISNMSIGLFDVDSIMPNLALMKISQFYKRQGHKTELAMPLLLNNYDKVYASKVFSNRHENDSYIQWKNPKWNIGGSGVSLKATLPDAIEFIQRPDYELYAIDYGIGFSSRGCRLKCKFCVVPEKEGGVHSNEDAILNFKNPKSNKILLLDNDFFGNPNWKKVSNTIINNKLRISISQGVNFRNITTEQLETLRLIDPCDIKFKRKAIYTAWDNTKDEKKFISNLKQAIKIGIAPKNITTYVLVGFNSTEQEDMHRIATLKDLGVNPFIMPYNKDDQYQKDLARYVNMKAIFKSVSFDQYKKEVKSEKPSFDLFNRTRLSA